MLKIPQKISIVLSMILSAVFGALIILIAVTLPEFVDAVLRELPNMGIAFDLSDAQKAAMLASLYSLVAVALLADGLLFALLCRVWRGLIFTGRSVALIRAVSWCVLLFAVGVFVFGWCFAPLLIVGFGCWGVSLAALLLGLCLRAVKNVIEQATAIKNENDLCI